MPPPAGPSFGVAHEPRPHLGDPAGAIPDDADVAAESLVPVGDHLAVVAGWFEEDRLAVVVRGPTQSVSRIGGMDLVAPPHVQHLETLGRVHLMKVQEDAAGQTAVRNHNVVFRRPPVLEFPQPGLVPPDAVAALGKAEDRLFVPAAAGVQAVPQLEKFVARMVEDARKRDGHACLPGLLSFGHSRNNRVAVVLPRLVQPPLHTFRFRDQEIIDKELPVALQSDRRLLGSCRNRSLSPQNGD